MNIFTILISRTMLHIAQYTKKIALCLLFAAYAVMAIGQESREISVAERNAQMGFNDTIDRLAEDFVHVSLMVADPTDWRDDILGMQGHAFLRLQCEVFDLDYCFSYESENVNTQLSKCAKGQLRMGMFTFPTNEYLEDYHKWNRAVHEYRLNLPPEVDIRLWEVLHNKLSRGLSLKLDLDRRGCAIFVVRFIKAALRDIPIVYPQGTCYETLSRREILYQDMVVCPWLRLVLGIVVPNAYNKDCPIDEKLIVPADLAEIWMQSTLNGKVFAEYIGDAVESDFIKETQPPFVTPQLVAWAILLITIILLLAGISWWKWPLLGVQCLVGVVLLYLALFTQLFTSAGWLMVVLFNPLPLLLWKWRKYWQLPYAILLLIEAIVLVCWPHMLVDPAYIIMLLSYIVLFGADTFKQLSLPLINHLQSKIR